jgi:hypothetical protein
MAAGMLGLLISLTGCASIFKGSSQNVPITSNPEGAQVWVDGVYRGTTPLKLQLDVKKSYAVRICKDGEEQNCTLVSKVSAGWVVLDVLGGLCPVVVDACTGSWNHLTPAEVCVAMQPGGASAVSQAATGQPKQAAVQTVSSKTSTPTSAGLTGN